MAQWTSDDIITPEYSKAVDHLLLVLSSNLGSNRHITSDIMLQGNTQQVTKTFTSKQIPSMRSWSWNQVRSRKQILLAKYRISFFKLSPRNRRKDKLVPPAPKYKLWQYHVIPHDLELRDFFVLWCQIGKSETKVPHHFVSKETLPKIEELSFLAPFMNPIVALELWPYHC